MFPEPLVKVCRHVRARKNACSVAIPVLPHPARDSLFSRLWEQHNSEALFCPPVLQMGDMAKLVLIVWGLTGKWKP